VSEHENHTPTNGSGEPPPRDPRKAIPRNDVDDDPVDVTFGRKSVLRSIIGGDSGDPEVQRLFAGNLRALEDNPIEWQRPDDLAIYAFVRDYHAEQAGAVPGMAVVRDHFERQGDLLVTERLRDIENVRPWVKSNFRWGLGRLQEEDRRVSAIALLREAADKIQKGGEDPAEVLAAVGKRAEIALPKKKAVKQRKTDRDVLDLWTKSGPVIHEPTGFGILDARTGGGPVYGTRWYLLGAPDAGKTALLIQCGDAWARRGVVVGILAVDEEAEDLVTRNVQRLELPPVPTDVDLDGNPLPRERFTRADCERRTPHVVKQMVAVMGEVPRVYYDAEWTIEEAAADLDEYARSLSTPETPRRAALLVDSVQTAECDAIRAATRDLSERQVVTANVRGVRAVAIKYAMITIATSEMNRAAYRSIREGDEQPSDMVAGKESGAIEYGARVMVSLRSVQGDPDRIQVRIPKNKHGPSWRSTEDDFYLRIDRPSQTITDAGAPETASESTEARQERRRRDRRAAQEQTLLAQMTADDTAAKTLIEARPDAPQRELVAELKRLRACGTERARDALQRVHRA